MLRVRRGGKSPDSIITQDTEHNNELETSQRKYQLVITAFDLN